MAEKLDDESAIRLLLVGKTGEGKSSTGNSIIGTKKFESKGDHKSTTRISQMEMAHVQGHNVAVVDTPGLAGTEMTTAEGLDLLQREVLYVLTNNSDGFDAILIVIRYGSRITDEYKVVFDQLDSFFGETYTKEYGILVVTHVDNYEPEENENKTFQDFLKSQGGGFKEMLAKCNNRMIHFDNRTRNETFRQDQVKSLLDMVAKMKQGSKRYTPKAFTDAQDLRYRVILQNRKPVIDQKNQEELEIITSKLQSIPKDSKDIVGLARLEGQLEKQRQSLVEQDKGTDALSDTISKVLALEEEIENQISSISERRQRDDAAMAEMVNTLKEELRMQREEFFSQIQLQENKRAIEIQKAYKKVERERSELEAKCSHLEKEQTRQRSEMKSELQRREKETERQRLQRDAETRRAEQEIQNLVKEMAALQYQMTETEDEAKKKERGCSMQ